MVAPIDGSRAPLIGTTALSTSLSPAPARDRAACSHPEQHSLHERERGPRKPRATTLSSATAPASRPPPASASSPLPPPCALCARLHHATSPRVCYACGVRAEMRRGAAALETDLRRLHRLLRRLS
eukprot:2075035-Rhodomonas_salina.1